MKNISRFRLVSVTEQTFIPNLQLQPPKLEIQVDLSYFYLKNGESPNWSFPRVTILGQ